MIYSLEALRLFFIFSVTLLHFNYRFIPQGYLGVEFFFILSGFLTCVHGQEKAAVPLAKMFRHKITKLYRPYILSVLVTLLAMSALPTLRQTFLAVTMLQSVGFDPVVVNWPTWFFSVYIWSWLLLRLLIQEVSPKWIAYVTAGIGLIGYGSMVLKSPSHGINFSADTYIYGLTIGLLRGISGMNLGYAVGFISRPLLEHRTRNANLRRLFALIQFVAMASMIYAMFLAPITPWLDIPFIACVCLMLSLGIHQSDGVSRILNFVGTKLHPLTKLSLPMFLIHFPVLLIWQHFLGEAPRKRWILVYFATNIAAAYLLDKASRFKRQTAVKPMHVPQKLVFGSGSEGRN